MKSTVLRIAAAGAAVALLSGSAFGQLIVANDQTGTGTIYNVNPDTGAATPIYSSSTAESKAWGMAYDENTNTLYWNNGGILYRSPFGPTLVPQTLGQMTFNGANVNFVALGMLNGKLYGTRNIATEAVYSIDVTTLAATQEYVYPSAFDFGGLDRDVSTGRLYGLTDANTPGLYEFDLGGQTQTFKAPYPAGETDIDALAVHDGLAYYVTDGPNTTQPNFYVYNVATGTQVRTLPSPFTGSGTFSAATYIVPEPGTAGVVMLAAGLAGALGRRRR